MKEFFKSWVQKRQLVENFCPLFWTWVAFSWVLITDSHGSLNQSPIFKSHQTPADLFFSSPSRLSSMAFLQKYSFCQLSLSTLYHKPPRSMKTQGAAASPHPWWKSHQGIHSLRCTSPFSESVVMTFLQCKEFGLGCFIFLPKSISCSIFQHQ